MIGHLGSRVSALLDGQLPSAEADEAWAHVYACHQCRDLVEREGWIKTRLAGLADGCDPTRATPPSGLKGSLLNLTPGEVFLATSHGTVHRRGVSTGVAFVGGGALGAALLGVLAFGVLPGATTPERRPPVTRIDTSKPPVPTVQRPSEERSAPSERVAGSVPTGNHLVDVSSSVPTWTFFE